jgi:DNA-directed RNA polymerase subunit RPC12/RpoP
MPAVVNYIKGRTKCTKCKHEFVLDVSDNDKKLEAVCPSCNNKFTIQAADSSSESEDGDWEEHGESRKTILSSAKPKTNKPKIAAVILICVFVIGLSTSVFSEAFVESSMYALSSLGMKGTVEIHVKNNLNESIENISVEIEDFGSVKKTGNESYVAHNVQLGIKDLKINAPGYENITQEILVTPLFTSYQDITMKKGVGNEPIFFDTVGFSFIFVVFSIFSLIAAIACFKRVHFDTAAVCCILSIFSLGFFLIGLILGVIAFIIILKSKEEFDNGKKGKVF